MLQRLKDIQKDFEEYSIAKGKPVQDLKTIISQGNIGVLIN